MDENKKIDINYKKMISISKEEKKQIEDVYKIETRRGIIFIIDTFGPCIIKKLASVLNKNEATIYHHIREMRREPSLLIIDED